MAKKIYRFRIGKDAHVKLRVTTNNEVISLAGRDIEVELVDSLRGVRKMDFSIVGNTILFDFYGIDQKIVGMYRIVVWENRGRIGETAHDMCDAFEIVSTTCQEHDLMDGLDQTSLDYDVNIEVITKSGIYSKSVRNLEVVSTDDYDSMPEHDKETLYVLTRPKEVRDGTERSR